MHFLPTLPLLATFRFSQAQLFRKARYSSRPDLNTPCDSTGARLLYAGDPENVLHSQSSPILPVLASRFHHMSCKLKLELRHPTSVARVDWKLDGG